MSFKFLNSELLYKFFIQDCHAISLLFQSSNARSGEVSCSCGDSAEDCLRMMVSHEGQTLKKVGLYLSTPVFSHGQYYVGLSRAGSFEAVKVLVVDHEKQGLYEHNEGIPDGVYTDNVVWKEALLQREGVATLAFHLTHHT